MWYPIQYTVQTIVGVAIKVLVEEQVYINISIMNVGSQNNLNVLIVKSGFRTIIIETNIVWQSIKLISNDKHFYLVLASA